MSAVRPSRFNLNGLVLDILSDPESDIITASRVNGIFSLSKNDHGIEIESIAKILG